MTMFRVDSAHVSAFLMKIKTYCVVQTPAHPHRRFAQPSQSMYVKSVVHVYHQSCTRRRLTRPRVCPLAATDV